MRNFITLDIAFIYKHDLDKSEMILMGYFASQFIQGRGIKICNTDWHQFSKLGLSNILPCISDKPDTIYRVIKRLERKDLIKLLKKHGSEYYTLTEMGLKYLENSKYNKRGNEKPDDNPNESEDNPNESDNSPSESEETSNSLDQNPKTPYSIGGREEKGVLEGEKNIFSMNNYNWTQEQRKHVEKHVRRNLETHSKALPMKPSTYVREVVDWLYYKGHEVTVHDRQECNGVMKMVKIWVEQNVVTDELGGTEIHPGHLLAMEFLKLDKKQKIVYYRNIGLKYQGEFNPNKYDSPHFCAFAAEDNRKTGFYEFEKDLKSSRYKEGMWATHSKLWKDEDIKEKLKQFGS